MEMEFATMVYVFAKLDSLVKNVTWRLVLMNALDMVFA